jgi:Protein of unknown function (DUF3761)
MTRAAALIGTVILLLVASGAQTEGQQLQGDCGYYINSDGNRVPRPCGDWHKDAPPKGATAKCRDGTFSYSQHHSGTCSGHGGVASWL